MKNLFRESKEHLMKIVYIVPHDVTKLDGVTKKIAMQLGRWQENGHEVKCISIVPEVGNVSFSCEQYVAGNPIFRRLVVHEDICRSVSEFKPEVIYLRFEGWSATYEYLSKRYRIVLEINTNVEAELRLNLRERRSLKSFLAYGLHIFLDRRLLERVHGIVAMTNEIGRNYHNVPVAVVPNGIVLSDTPVVKKATKTGDRIKCFFIGTGGFSWHGIDIIELIASQCPEFDFHIVGQTGTNKSNVFFHGYMTEDRYLEVLRESHVCIGTLGLFRKGMKEACPLKLREYLARGYPVIIGYKDTSFFNTEPDFLYFLDCRYPSSIDINGFKSYVIKMMGQVVHHDALKDIDADLLEIKRINFFREIASANV